MILGGRATRCSRLCEAGLRARVPRFWEVVRRGAVAFIKPILKAGWRVRVPRFWEVVRRGAVVFSMPNLKHQNRISKSDTFSIFACHPCAGAMLIFSVSFQFLRMTPKSSEQEKLACTCGSWRRYVCVMVGARTSKAG